MGEVQFIDESVARIGVDKCANIPVLWLKQLSIDATNIEEVEKAIAIYRRLISK